MAFLALGSTGDFSVGPYVGGWLGDKFLLAMDFLRPDRVGSKRVFIGAVPLLTTGV